MAQPVGGTVTGQTYLNDWTGIGQSALDPIVGGYSEILKELERLKAQRQSIGLASSLYGTNYGEGKGSLLFPSGETPDYMLSRQQREDRDLLDLQIAALDSRIQELTSAYPFLQVADRRGEIGPNQALIRGDWDKAIAVEAQRQLAQGKSTAEVNKWMLAAQDNLAAGRSASTEDPLATARATELLPAWAQRKAAETTPTGIDPDTVGGGTAEQENKFFQYTSLGYPVETAAQMAYGADIPAPIQGWIAKEGTQGQSAMDLAQANYYTQLGREKELSNQYAEQQANINSGVLGGLNAQGRFAPQDVQSYLSEPGLFGQVAQAQMSEMTGGPTAWQMQQWQAEQDRYAQTLAMQQQQVAADNAYRQQALAQQAAYQQAMLEQQRREMAAQIGQAVANMANQSYMDTLGYRLPAGTQYAPGFEPGGTLSQMASMSGLNYNPSKIGVANPPTTDELMRTVQEAISRF